MPDTSADILLAATEELVDVLEVTLCTDDIAEESATDAAEDKLDDKEDDDMTGGAELTVEDDI